MLINTPLNKVLSSIITTDHMPNIKTTSDMKSWARCVAVISTVGEDTMNYVMSHI